MLNHSLLPKLRRLRLSGMLETLETRAQQATREQWEPTEFLGILLDDELERRDHTRLDRRISEAGVDPAKTLASFDFGAVPALSRRTVEALGTAQFVARAQNIILAGPAGVGKSHLMNGLVIEALKRGYSGLYRPAHWVLTDLQASRGDGTYRRRLHGCCRWTCWRWTTWGCGP
ncbi:MAG: ATP-binding protein [Chloroflexota bacterium]